MGGSGPLDGRPEDAAPQAVPCSGRVGGSMTTLNSPRTPVPDQWSERPMPSAVEAERALLGALLQEPELLSRVSTDVQPDDFYRPEHAALYRLLLSMQTRQVPIDLVTVAQEILRGDGANRYGSAAYVSELPEHEVSTANAAHHADLVVGAASRADVVADVGDAVRAC